MAESSAFIKAMHPKTEISPTRAAVDKILRAGWAGQMKIHGHRAQVHLHADEKVAPVVYNRQGKPHKKPLPPKMARELRRIFNVKKGWTVIDGEWLKDEDRMFIFDVLKLDGKPLRGLNYAERFALLPRAYISPHFKTLPLLKTAEQCMEVLEKPDGYIEGLVFKSLTSKGFSDTSIIRCRKRR